MNSNSGHAETKAANDGSAERRAMIYESSADAAVLFLTTLKEVGDVFPPLKVTAAGVLILVDTVSKFKHNREEWNELGRITAARAAGIAKYFGDDPPSDVYGSIESLNIVLGQITAEVQKMQQPRLGFLRVISVNSEKEKINSFYTRMTRELDTFNLYANAAILKMEADRNSESKEARLLASLSQEFGDTVPSKLGEKETPSKSQFASKLSKLLKGLDRSKESGTGTNIDDTSGPPQLRANTEEVARFPKRFVSVIMKNLGDHFIEYQYTEDGVPKSGVLEWGFISQQPTVFVANVEYKFLLRCEEKVVTANHLFTGDEDWDLSSYFE